MTKNELRIKNEDLFLRNTMLLNENQKLRDKITALLNGNYIAKLKKENAELKEKLTAIRKAKDKYDLSKDKSIIKALGAEYTLFCDLERILEEMEIEK